MAQSFLALFATTMASTQEINREPPMSDATENLINNQTQLDADGTMVGVSRQALEETLGELEYAYRCIENGFATGNYDFTVLRTRASLHLAELDGGVGARRSLLLKLSR
jgi:hypothetical protein